MAARTPATHNETEGTHALRSALLAGTTGGVWAAPTRPRGR